MFIAAGKFSQKIVAVFCWFQGPGFLWVQQIMGSQNVMGSGYGSNTTELSPDLTHIYSCVCSLWSTDLSLYDTGCQNRSSSHL
jgi:hypothetical protein